MLLAVVGPATLYERCCALVYTVCSVHVCVFAPWLKECGNWPLTGQTPLASKGGELRNASRLQCNRSKLNSKRLRTVTDVAPLAICPLLLCPLSSSRSHCVEYHGLVTRPLQPRRWSVHLLGLETSRQERPAFCPHQELAVLQRPRPRRDSSNSKQRGSASLCTKQNNDNNNNNNAMQN